jgi:UDP-N-acetylmuramate dehydrogenase
MNFIENAPLAEHSTMKLGGNARYMCSVTTEDELIDAINFADKNTLTIRMIGTGSNIIWRDEGFDGLVIVNELTGLIVENTLVKIGSGMNWDDAVAQTVQAGLSGLEFLSLIPGSCGATPVQNVGAYGVEIQDFLVELRAYDTKTKEFVTIKNNECEFGYRTSRFKTTDAGRFMITEITLTLKKGNPKPPFYESLQNYLDNKNISEYTPQIIRDAVIAIRQSKLPNPENVSNNGSFFANPIIDNSQYIELTKKYPDIKAWNFGDKKKIAAGWLVEQAGFKDVHDEKTGMATWKNQSLVLVNEHASSTADLITFRDAIVNAVEEKFGITLEQEPELL